MRINQGAGIVRDRYGLEGQNLTSKVARMCVCVYVCMREADRHTQNQANNSCLFHAYIPHP